MKVVKVLFQLILILAVLGGSVFALITGCGSGSAEAAALEEAYFKYPTDPIGLDAAIATKLADVLAGYGYTHTYDAATFTFSEPVKSSTPTLTANSKEMVYALYRIACLADSQVEYRSYKSSGWGDAKLTGKTAGGAMDTYSSGASVAYTAADKKAIEALLPGGSYGWSDTYTIVTECSDASIKGILEGVLNLGKQKQTGTNGDVLIWNCAAKPEITAKGGNGVYMDSGIKVYNKTDYAAEFASSDRAYTYVNELDWGDPYGESSPERGGHVINTNTMLPRVITKAQYDTLAENKGLTAKEASYNPIETDLTQYLKKCDKDGTLNENGEYYVWDYIIELTDKESGKKYYRINFALDCENEETTKYSAASLAKSVGGAANIGYTAYSATYEIWDNGLFKMCSSNEQWHLAGAGALASLGLEADSDANSLEYYSYDKAFVLNFLADRYIEKADASDATKKVVFDDKVLTDALFKKTVVAAA